MIEMITIRRLRTREWDGKVLDAAEALKDQFGSPTNAIVNMVRQSPLFIDELAKMNSEAKCRRKRGAV